jgi:hypothetical protein
MLLGANKPVRLLFGGLLNSAGNSNNWLSNTLRAIFLYKQHVPTGNLGLIIIHFFNCGGVILRKQSNLIYPFIIAIAIFLPCFSVITKVYMLEILKHSSKTFTINKPIPANVSTIDLEPIGVLGDNLHFLNSSFMRNPDLTTIFFGYQPEKTS